MVRVKRGTMANKSRRNLLARVKGYRNGRRKKEAMAHDAVAHAGNNAFKGRKLKKRDYRSLWNTRINAALRSMKLPSYSVFMGSLKKKEIELDRKVLSTLAKDSPEIFERFTKAI